jgi:NAD(P)-dependent dehydrogenase (short-subunit alcohol dehydrogenase family)
MTIDKPAVLVTGAGGGLGRAIADHFHDQGYHVVATDYEPSLLSELEGTEGYTTAKLDVTGWKEYGQPKDAYADMALGTDKLNAGNW